MEKKNTPPAPEKAKKLTFVELSALTVGDLSGYLKKIVRVDLAVTKARDAMTASLKFSAKCVAALKRAYVARLNSREIPPDTKFNKYFEQNAGGKLPGRVEAMACLFNALVLTMDANGKPLLTEECYDAAAESWLEAANPIVKHAQKQHGDAWKTCDDILDLVNALSKPGDAMKAIKEIRKRQTGKGEGDENIATEAQPLTVGRAVEFLIAAIQNASKVSEEEGYKLFCETLKVGDAWSSSGVSQETMNTWADKFEKATKNGVDPSIEVITPETPAAAPEAPAAEAPEVEAEAVAA